MSKSNYFLFTLALLTGAAYAGFYTFNYVSDKSMACHASASEVALPARKGVTPNLFGNIKIDFPTNSITLVSESTGADGSHVQRNSHVQTLHAWSGHIAGVRVLRVNVSESESGTVGADYGMLVAGSIYPYASQPVANHISLVKLGLMTFFCEREK